MFTNTNEAGLESLIVKWLVEQNHYEQGHSHDFNVEYAVDTVRLFRFLKDTQPDAVKKLQLETNPQNCGCAPQGYQGLSRQPHHVLYDAQRK